MIPLVDLSLQHEAIAAEVSAGWQEVVAGASFILGPQVERFEARFAAFCGVEHCIGVGNGTDALELALRALGIGPGHRVAVPANTFVASVAAVLRAGAEAVLVDCEPDTHLIDLDRLGDVVARGGVEAVMPVHLYGQTAPVEEIRSLAGDLPIVEDAAQSQGASRHGRPAGSLGTIAGTSFYPGKNLGAYGDAGAVLTSDGTLADRVQTLRNWGSRVKYHHPELGFNSRLDSLQAVVLSAKLRHLAAWNEERRQAADRYGLMLGGLDDVITPVTLPGNVHVWHLYVVRVPRRDEVLTQMQAGGIGVGVHYPVPVHLHQGMRSLGYQAGDFPVAERLASEILSLPLFPGITESQQEQVVECLTRCLMG
jgi:dTDP-4-amino-4,6-dideoxygalactose transaminase